MPLPARTVAIAALSSHLPSLARSRRAGAIAALDVVVNGDEIGFEFRSHIVSSPDKLRRWLDDLLIGDPIIVGYDLIDLARLLVAAGYDRHLVKDAAPETCRELRLSTDIYQLATVAALNGMMAAEEGIIVLGPPIAAHVAADLALLNAVAVWVIHIQGIARTEIEPEASCALGSFVQIMAYGAIPPPIAAALTTGVQ